jgi:hypothetical protein
MVVSSVSGEFVCLCVVQLWLRSDLCPILFSLVSDMKTVLPVMFCFGFIIFHREKYRFTFILLRGRAFRAYGQSVNARIAPTIPTTPAVARIIVPGAVLLGAWCL